eukprot:Blabericola_migrator_1__12216@NODE_75_length_15195_cov_183_882866_g67_i0_p2_GENE_NODE_75_length_15195_cov_183_882866_g67_i0NODE_75_length_15195_cov_183_882866_g67_i0_p2_ORF_typecomplete_len1373_score251_99PX/PF00787_24/3_5e11PX/PF00787_24/3_1e03Atg14/PF10186_9/0_2Atg14/PF10186_9/2_3SKA1/PF07160_12/6_8SKA1/PF07160_12/13PI_PP_I/PF18363_1/0_95BAR_3/PF16746_5/0_52BAR_3/PF16746_5/3_7e02HAUS5/PF14817_6/38HAUS5/PF14817_6/1_1MT/PF12777_7/1_5MT/PF12777_7/24Fib_alpha/PF08702_10/9_5Fib_alpha/PF08702_10/40E
MSAERRHTYLTIRVAGSTVVTNSLLAKHADYIIEIAEAGRYKTVHRRFAAFVELHRQIQASGDYPTDKPLPELPPKRMFGTLLPHVLEERRHALNSYLEALTAASWPTPLFDFLDLAPETIVVIKFLTLGSLGPRRSDKKVVNVGPPKWGLLKLIGITSSPIPHNAAGDVYALTDREMQILSVIGELFMRRAQPDMYSRLSYFAIMKRLVGRLLVDASTIVWTLSCAFILNILDYLLTASSDPTNAKTCMIQCRGHIRLLEYLSRLHTSNASMSCPLLVDTAKDLLMTLAVHDPISFFPLFRTNSKDDVIISIIKSPKCLPLHSFVSILILVCFSTADARGVYPSLHSEFADCDSILRQSYLWTSPCSTLRVLLGLLCLKLRIPLPPLASFLEGIVANSLGVPQGTDADGKVFRRARYIMHGEDGGRLISRFTDAYKDSGVPQRKYHVVTCLEILSQHLCSDMPTADPPPDIISRAITACRWTIEMPVSVIPPWSLPLDLPLCLLGLNLLDDILNFTLCQEMSFRSLPPAGDSTTSSCTEDVLGREYAKFIMFVCLALATTPRLRERGALGPTADNQKREQSGFDNLGLLDELFVHDQAPFFFFCSFESSITSLNSFLGPVFAASNETPLSRSDSNVTLPPLLEVFAESRMLELRELLKPVSTVLCNLALRGGDEVTRIWAAALYLFGVASTSINSSYAQLEEEVGRVTATEASELVRDLEEQVETLLYFCQCILEHKLERQMDRVLRVETEVFRKLAEEIAERLRPPPPACLLEEGFPGEGGWTAQSEASANPIRGLQRPSTPLAQPPTDTSRADQNSSTAFQSATADECALDVGPDLSEAVSALRDVMRDDPEKITTPTPPMLWSELPARPQAPKLSIVHSTSVSSDGLSSGLYSTLENEMRGDVAGDWSHIPHTLSRLTQKSITGMGQVSEGSKQMRSWRQTHLLLLTTMSRSSHGLKNILVSMIANFKAHKTETEKLKNTILMWLEAEHSLSTLEKELDQLRQACQAAMKSLMKLTNTQRTHLRHIAEAENLVRRLETESRAEAKMRLFPDSDFDTNFQDNSTQRPQSGLEPSGGALMSGSLVSVSHSVDSRYIRPSSPTPSDQTSERAASSPASMTVLRHTLSPVRYAAMINDGRSQTSESVSIEPRSGRSHLSLQYPFQTPEGVSSRLSEVVQDNNVNKMAVIQIRTIDGDSLQDHVDVKTETDHSHIQSRLRPDTPSSVANIGLKGSREALENLISSLPKIELEVRVAEEQVQKYREHIDQTMDSVYRERRQMNQTKSVVAKMWLKLALDLERDIDTVLDFIQSFGGLNMDLLEVGYCRHRLIDSMSNERMLRTNLRKDVTKLMMFAERLASWLGESERSPAVAY